MQIVNFETAKLAKMKGYDEPTRSWYNFAGLFILGCEEVSKTIDRKHLSPVTVKIGLIPSMANKLNNCKYYKGITK